MKARWTYFLKRRFGNRFALTAVLFLAVMAWGSAVVFTALVDSPAGGFETELHASKTDPTAPSRTLRCAATDLRAPAPAPNYAKAAAAQTAAAEEAVTKALEEEHSLIQLYGLYQNLAGRTVIEDTADPYSTVVKLPDGTLTFVEQGDPPNAKAQAAELKRLQLDLAERGCQFLYLQAPPKVDPDDDGLPAGVKDVSNLSVDHLLVQLDALGVDYIDFRQTLKAAGGDWSHWFYATDHHWTQEAAFLCFQELCQKLEAEYTQTTSVSHGRKTVPITIPPRYTDPDSYASTTLSGFFLGSQGKRVGSLYGGADDFVLHTPKFPTLMHYNSTYGGLRYGDITESVLFPERVAQRHWFDGTPYEYYAGGDNAAALLTNYYNPGGPRILVIRDSFACAMSPYLALISSQLTTIDPRQFSGDLLNYIDWLQPDVVMVLYSSNLVRSKSYFRLLSQPAGPSKADALRWKDDRSQK